MVAVCLCAVGCRQTAGPAAARLPARAEGDTAWVLKDDLGHLVRVKRTVERIVSLQPSNTEILFALGLGDKVVGVTSYCDYPPEARSKTRVGDLMRPSLEKVVELRPDLVLVGQGNDMRTVDALRELGIPTFALYPHSVEEVLTTIETVGRLTGAQSRAKELSGALRARVRAVVARSQGLPESQRPRVLFAYAEVPVTSAGKGTFIDDIIRLAGGVNVAATLGGEWPRLSPEAIVAADPQVVVSGWSSDYLSEEAVRRHWQRLRSEPGWSEVTALRKGHIFLCNLDYLVRPGPRLIRGLEMVADYLRPWTASSPPGSGPGSP